MMNIMKSIGMFLLVNWKGTWVGFSVLMLLSGILDDSLRVMIAGGVSLLLAGITALNGWGAVMREFGNTLAGKYSPELAVFLWGVVILSIGVLLYYLGIDYEIDANHQMYQAFGGTPLESLLTGIGGFMATGGVLFVFVYKRVMKD